MTAMQGVRRLRVGRDILAAGVEPGSDEARIIEDQAAGTIEMLADDSSLEATLAFAEATAASADMIIEVIAVPPRPLACARGCAYCCHLKINAAIPEVFSIAAYLQRRAAEPEVAAVRARLEAYMERTRHLSGNDRMTARLPCPLLVDDRCSVYPARPLTCRGWNSFDVSHCRRDFERPEECLPAVIFAPQLQAARSVLAGTEAGLALLRLEYESVDLARGLRIALEGSLDVLHRRWRSGEKAFFAAEDDAATKVAMDRWTQVRPCEE